MEKAIRSFPDQLKFKPVIENKKSLAKAKKFIVCGMGGSHIASDLLKTWRPSFDLIIHHDYGLPELSDNLKKYLIIISSYSGGTEEAISSFNLAIKKKLPIACISTGGQLLELAKKYKKPYIQMPSTGIEPRSALGFSLVSLLKLMGENKAISDIAKAAGTINMEELKQNGEALAKRLNNYVPIIYTSDKNGPIAYNWKIRFNETGKVPSFCNTFPELNHNEIVGFDGDGKTQNLLKNFYFIFIKDEKDNPRVLLRMDILKDIFTEKGLPVEVLDLKGKNIWEKIFSSLSLADWAAYSTAQQYGLKAQETAIIKKLKDAIKERGGKL